MTGRLIAAAALFAPLALAPLGAAQAATTPAKPMHHPMHTTHASAHPMAMHHGMSHHGHMAGGAMGADHSADSLNEQSLSAAKGGTAFAPGGGAAPAPAPAPAPAAPATGSDKSM
jgi:hypothetical protein